MEKLTAVSQSESLESSKHIQDLLKIKENFHCKDFQGLFVKFRESLLQERNVHTCNTCNREFSFESGLKQHTLTHTGKTIFRCVKCYITFPALYDFKIHECSSVAHSLPCYVCGKILTKSALIKHEETTHKQGPFKTIYLTSQNIVPKQIISCQVLQVQGTGNTDDLISIKGSQSSQENDLKASLPENELLNLSEKNEVMNSCNVREIEASVSMNETETEPLPTEVDESSMSDNDKKEKFKCKACSNSFASLLELKRHCLLHVENPELMCGICGEYCLDVKSFFDCIHSHDQRGVNQYGTKSIEAVNSWLNTIHKCSRCKEIFGSFVGLKRHRCFNLKKEKMLLCSICLRNFSKKYDYCEHMLIHTNMNKLTYKTQKSISTSKCSGHTIKQRENPKKDKNRKSDSSIKSDYISPIIVKLKNCSPNLSDINQVNKQVESKDIDQQSVVVEMLFEEEQTSNCDESYVQKKNSEQSVDELKLQKDEDVKIVNHPTENNFDASQATELIHNPSNKKIRKKPYDCNNCLTATENGDNLEINMLCSKGDKDLSLVYKQVGDIHQSKTLLAETSSSEEATVNTEQNNIEIIIPNLSKTERIPSEETCLPKSIINSQVSVKNNENSEELNINQEDDMEIDSPDLSLTAPSELSLYVSKCHWERRSDLFQCLVCFMSFECQYEFERHCIDKHLRNEKLETFGMVSCAYCTRTFNDKYSYEFHLQSHKVKFSCVVCNETFLSTLRLQRHYMNHAKYPPYECQTCKVAFKAKTAILNHYRKCH